MGRLARAAGGATLVAVAVVLSLQGVQVVRAEPLDSVSPPVIRQGAMCRADAPLASPAAIDRVAEAIAARGDAPGDGVRPQVQVLNGRGYNYRAAKRDVDLSALAREIAVQKRLGH